MNSILLSQLQWVERLGNSGQSFIEAAAAGDFTIYLYQPGHDDAQGAHSRSEFYFVVSGSGKFESGLLSETFHPGDALFVPAGEAHRFVGSDDVVVWAAFFGAPIDGKWHPAADATDTATLELSLNHEAGRQARVWSLQWSGAAGPAEGLGLAVGPHMACSRPSTNINGGVVVYGRQPDGSLRATWAHSERERLRPGSGKARRVGTSSEGFEGRYEIQYSNSSGDAAGPLFELEVAQAADRYDLAWRAGDISLSGIGAIRSGRLYAVWGDATDASSLGLSLLDLPVAGQDGAIIEQFLDHAAAEPSLRSWMRAET